MITFSSNVEFASIVNTSHFSCIVSIQFSWMLCNCCKYSKLIFCSSFLPRSHNKFSKIVCESEKPLHLFDVFRFGILVNAFDFFLTWPDCTILDFLTQKFDFSFEQFTFFPFDLQVSSIEISIWAPLPLFLSNYHGK